MQPFSIFSATGIDQASLHPNFRRIAVGHIAARLRWLIGHTPRRIKLLVQRKISYGMATMFLRLRRNGECDEDKECDSIGHAEPSNYGAAPHTAGQNEKLEGCEQRGAQELQVAELSEVGTDAS
jgi:hypothetical protein